MRAEKSETVLQVQLLGGFSFIYRAVPVDKVKTAHLQSLLAYLILHAGAPQSRQHVAFVLWPDTSEPNARNNLRQLLHQLRLAFPDYSRFVAADTSTLFWQPDPNQVVDVHRFRLALERAEAAERGDDLEIVRHALEQALSFYRGDLLPSCYDDWIIPEREDLQRQRLLAYRKLALVLERQRDYRAALQVAESLRGLDPLSEETYTLLMRLHALNSDPVAAERVYRLAVATLDSELGVAPSQALRQAHERLSQVDGLPGTLAEAPRPLVGREKEWSQLQVIWQRVVGGGSHFVLVTGEAGIGKSRLVEELALWARKQGFGTAYTRSYAAEGRLSLAPVAEWLRAAPWRGRLSMLDPLWLTQVARLLPELLNLHPGLARPEPITEYGQRQFFFEALARAVLAATPPLLLWIDDLQWCDPETLEWLHFLMRFKTTSSLLVAGTARSEELPPDHLLIKLERQLAVEGKLTSVELTSLNPAETARLAGQIAGAEIDRQIALRLYQETEGNPLFVVETVRAGYGSGETAIPDPTKTNASMLPPRVHAVIARRLGQLSPAARQIAEAGAVIGRAFTLQVLLLAQTEDEVSVSRSLAELWQKRIIREESANTYDFTHDKLREVAYAEISPPQRRLLHRRVAQALEGLNAGHLDLVSAEIAAQYEQAGLFDEAIPYYQRAGALAASIFANDDAISLYTRGLTLLLERPSSEKRDKQELAFLLALAPLYRITKGWASREVERVLNRALLLSEKVGDLAQRMQTLFGMQSLYVVQAQLERVEHTYREVDLLSQQKNGAPPPPFARLHVTGAQLHMGQFARAREGFEKVVALRDPKYIKDLEASQGVNYLVHGHAWNAHALWCLGYVDRALESANAAVELAREYVQPFNQALAITYRAMLQEMRADPETFRIQAQEALALTQEYKAPYYRDWSSILVRFGQAWQTPDVENVRGLHEAIQAFTDTGARLRLPYYLSLLARAYQRAGQPGKGLYVIEQAMTESLRNNERWWDAELHRLRGELLRAQGADAGAAEAAFRRALEIARSQQAKSLELRAVNDLAQILRTQARAKEARALIVPVVEWFHEGLETPDLQAARNLVSGL